MMKNNEKNFLFPITVGILCFFILIGISICALYFLLPETPTRYVSRVLRIKIPSESLIIIDKYDGPSFPTGDGYSWLVIQVPPQEINNFITLLKASPEWKPLPLPKELADYESCLQPTILLNVEEIPISNVTGYYIFIDKQKEHNKTDISQNPDLLEPFCERSSLNYIFGLFNEKDGILYMWSIDT